jgi:hypothetical protein
MFYSFVDSSILCMLHIFILLSKLSITFSEIANLVLSYFIFLIKLLSVIEGGALDSSFSILVVSSILNLQRF